MKSKVCFKFYVQQDEDKERTLKKEESKDDDDNEDESSNNNADEYDPLEAEDADEYDDEGMYYRLTYLHTYKENSFFGIVQTNRLQTSDIIHR